MDHGTARTERSIVALLTDVDGTLVTENKVITERASQAVNG